MRTCSPRPEVENRASFSLLEILVASAILTMALVPLSESFHLVIFGFQRTGESTHGAFLAQSVMENIRYRFYNFDSRYCTMNTSDAAQVAAIQQKAYETFFNELAEVGQGRWVTARDGTTSKYFLEFENLQGLAFHPIRPDSAPLLYRELADYSAQVIVSFEEVPALAEEDPLWDPRQQVDLANLTVVVSWLNRDGEYRESRYSTVLTRYLYEPHDKS